MRRTQFTISINHVRYFNPRTPYGMRLLDKFLKFNVRGISIHAPLTGCDSDHTSTIALIIFDFNPRTPYGMRQGRDGQFSSNYNFNPRTPYGMRPQKKQNHYLNFTLFDKFILSYSQNYDN